MTVPHHASDETLAAFADGRLRGAERREVIEHLAACDACRDIVAAAGEARDADVIETARVVDGGFGRKVAVVALAAAAAVAIAFLPPVREKLDFYRTGGLSALVRATRQLDEWPLQTRLSGGFPTTKRVHRTFRGGGDDADLTKHLDRLRIEAAHARVLENANPSSVRGLHAIGIAHLLNRKTNEAVAALEAARRMQTRDDPALLTDLAAAYVERGDRQLALQTAQRAWQVAKTPESTWNLARAYELNERKEDAIRMYREYLKLDSDSSFADEATSRIGLLEHELY